MATASNAALAAPGLPMASVATGTPFGIWTMDSRESMPCKQVDGTGTPNTGTIVLAASIPGKCAAPPAAAMMIFSPRGSASSAYWKSQSGVRWAETIRASWGMANSRNSSRQGSSTS